MLQKNFCVTKQNGMTIDDVINETSSMDAYADAAQILLCVFMEHWEADFIRNIAMKLKKALPKIEIAGITHRDTFEYVESENPNIRLNFMFFDNPAFTVKRCDISRLSDAEAGRAINREIGAVSDIKGAMLFISEFGRDVDIIMKESSANFDDVPIFGAPGNMLYGLRVIPEADGSVGVNYVFDAEGCYFDEVVAVMFHGADLHLKVSYNLGWTPVGSVMTITDMKDPFTVSMINDRPAGEIYRKYLGLDYSQITIPNICEFPLVVERNGLTMARIPVGCSEDGSLMFNSSLNKDENIRFSYGAQFRIFSEIYGDSIEFKEFAPQAMLLIICGNRLIFLKDDEEHEVDHYRQIAPDLDVLHGGAELWRYGGRGGVLNSALVAVGIREGEAAEMKNEIHFSCPCEESIRKDINVPLEYRIMTFMHSVTEDLEEMTRQANAANEAKSAFLSNMTHEIRSPINAVLGMDEMILRESSEDAVIDYAENIKSAGGTLLGLVNDVLDMSKIEAGKMTILPVEYHMASVINDLVAMISQRAQDKGLELILDISPDLPGTLYGDEIRFKQIVTNILTNAVKYTEKGSVTLHIGLAGMDDDSAVIEVSVRDTGIGIKEEDIAKLFRAFERIEEKRNRSIEGTGLGMNITSALLGMMGSELLVDSVYGEGSDFHFQLKQKVVDASPIGNYQEALRRVRERRKRYHESFTAPEARILVVDDTPMNLLVLKNLLKKTEVQIFTADSGERCLVMIQREKYDMIFLDDRMPGLSGVETLARMLDTEHLNMDVPVIILTANSADDAQSYYMDKGFSDYLAKPIDPQVLENMLKKYLPADKIHLTGDTSDGNEDVLAVNLYDDSITEEARRIYLENLDENAALIDEYYRNEQWDDYTIKVHALKSSSRIIGETELGDLAEKLEYAGDSRDLDFIKAHHDELMSMYRAVPLKYVTLENDPDDMPEISADELREALDMIHELAVSFDFDSIDDIMKQLEGYSIPVSMRGRFDRVKQAVVNVDWVNM